jgi:Leucine-rich repeat (LRR) protein
MNAQSFSFLLIFKLVVLSSMVSFFNSAFGCINSADEQKHVSLEQFLREKIDKPIGELKQEDFKDVRELGIVDMGLTSLDGLQYCSKLNYLDASSNRIINISQLSGMKNLNRLALSFNKIVDISPLANLHELKHLILSGNRIKDISPLINLEKIWYLDLSYNQIEDLTPLIENKGFLNGVICIRLTGNPLNEKSIKEDIPLLKDLEIEVDYSDWF